MLIAITSAAHPLLRSQWMTHTVAICWRAQQHHHTTPKTKITYRIWKQISFQMQ